MAAVVQVSDFGLSARLSTEQTHVSNVHSGTMTHMAPEVLLAGQLSKASDVYAFGIILYELFSGKRPFEGLSMQQVMHHVGTLGKRPVFLPGVPVRVVELACLCWGPVDKRPTFPEIVTTLRALLNDFKMGLLTSRRAMPVSGFNSKSSDEEQAMPNGSPGQNRNVASSASSSSFEPSTDMGDIRALQMGGHARPIFQQQLPTARAE